MGYVIAIVVAGVGLFWPVYDLSVSTDLKNYPVVDENFLTLSSCREAAGSYRPKDYVCLQKTGWGLLTNDYSKYDSKHQ